MGRTLTYGSRVQGVVIVEDEMSPRLLDHDHMTIPSTKKIRNDKSLARPSWLLWIFLFACSSGQ